ncbi:hypothetical protein [Pseudorhodoplanes sp.]
MIIASLILIRAVILLCLLALALISYLAVARETRGRTRDHEVE